jgi:transcriptional regulator with XRE-family HTH domain
MENQNLAQRLKVLRKRKALSQDDLAKNAGLSLRTVQRVENGDTIPTAETLKRLAIVLDVATNELTDFIIDGETPKQKVKTKFEYLHIFESKLVFSKTPEIDLVKDYTKSVESLLTGLMIIFIFIIGFIFEAFVFYNKQKMDMVLFAVSWSILFLTFVLYIMFFNSRTPVIDIQTIRSIKIKNNALNEATVEIHLIESKRLKARGLILEKKQVDLMIEKVLAEKLITENDIKTNTKWNFLRPFIFFIIAASILQMWIFSQFLKSPQYYQSAFIFFLSLLMIIKMFRNSVFLSKETLNKGFVT